MFNVFIIKDLMFDGYDCGAARATGVRMSCPDMMNHWKRNRVFEIDNWAKHGFAV